MHKNKTQGKDSSLEDGFFIQTWRQVKGKGNGVVIGKWYFAKDSTHAKNKVLYANLTHDFVLTQSNIMDVTNKKR